MTPTASIDKQQEGETTVKQLLNPSAIFWYHVNTSHQYSEEEEEDDSDYGEDDQAICGCGKPLSAGWDCKQCRTNCTGCNRALASDEKCSRCSVKRGTEK
jgi:hypothetical protein